MNFNQTSVGSKTESRSAALVNFNHTSVGSVTLKTVIFLPYDCWTSSCRSFDEPDQQNVC